MKKIITFLIAISLSTGLMAQEWGLQRCIDFALENNIDLKLNSLQNKLKEQDANQAKYNRLPNLNASASHGYNWGQRIDPFTNSFASERVRNNNLNLISNIVLYNGSRVNNQIKKAKMDLSAGMIDMEETSNQIIIQVSQVYLRHILAIEQVDIAQNQLIISSEQSDRMSKLVEAGQEAKGTLYDLEAQYALDELALVNAQNEVLLSKVSLVNLLQLDAAMANSFIAKAPSISESDLVLPLISAADLYQSAISNMPEVKASELREEQAMLDAEIAKSIGLPTLSLYGSIGSGYSGLNTESVGDPIISYLPIGQVGIGGETVYSLGQKKIFNDFQTKSFSDQLDQNFNQSIGLNLQIPIFNNYSSKITSKKAAIAMDMARINTESINNKLYRETQDVYARTIAALNKYKSSKKSVLALEQNYDNAKKRFEQGIINSTEFNTAKINLQMQQSQMLIAKYEYVFRSKIMEIYMNH